MSTYPDYVKKYRPKGTIIKKENEQYYVYKAHYEKIPGQKLPRQVIDSFVGRIDQDGLHESPKKALEIHQAKIREYGFTNYLLRYKDFYIKHNKGLLNEESLNDVFKSIIVHLSRNSYLIDECLTFEYMEEKMSSEISKLASEFKRNINIDWKKIEDLKTLCFVEVGGQRFYGELTMAQTKYLKDLGLTETELQHKK